MKKGRYTFWCNLIIKVLFEINYYIFRMIGISTKWLAPNFYEVPKEQYKKYNLVDYEVIVEKEKKRLGVKHQKITLNDIGLSLGSKDNDLFKLVQKEKIKIVNFSSKGYRKSSFKICASKSVEFTVQKGTLLFPFEEGRANNTQTLMIADDLSTQASQGQSQFEVQTFCYNSQLRAPGKEKYLFGNIKSVLYEKGMSQGQVWDLTRKQRVVVQEIQKKYEREDELRQLQNKNKRPNSAQR